MATTSGAAPLKRVLLADAPAVAAAVDKSTVVGEVIETGVVGGVSYVPVADITGANTDSRTFNLINKGQDGNGTMVIATLAMTVGVNASDFDEKQLTLSGTAANLAVSAGDILAFASVHVGSTGLADPGGKVQVEVNRD